MVTQVLTGYDSRETAYEVKDYPWGYTLRTSKFCWVESKRGNGDRFGSYTIDPKKGRDCATKYDIYYTFVYMYLDEKGHIQHGVLTIYELEKFPAHFKEVMGHVGFENVNEIQKENIRNKLAGTIKADAYYKRVKYSNEKRGELKQWLDDTLYHIFNCEFEKLADYPAPPEEDNPEGKVEVVIKQHTPEPPADPGDVAAIIEAIKAIIEKELPRFWYEVTERKSSFSGSYIAIKIAASVHEINRVQGQHVQMVSLSLDPNKWDLHTQVFGGMGGQSIYRKINPEIKRERNNAMASERVPFRTPKPNQKDVLRAIELFCINYKKKLAEHFEVLIYHDIVDYDKLLNG